MSAWWSRTTWTRPHAEFALDSDGHEARLAFDGQAAVEPRGSSSRDAVVLDVGLPGMNGYEVARAIRDLPGLAR